MFPAARRSSTGSAENTCALRPPHGIFSEGLDPQHTRNRSRWSVAAELTGPGSAARIRPGRGAARQCSDEAPLEALMVTSCEVPISGRGEQDIEGQIGRTGTAIAPLKPRGTVPNSGLAEAFDNGRALGSAAANNIGHCGFAHPALDSRTEASLSRNLSTPRFETSAATLEGRDYCR